MQAAKLPQPPLDPYAISDILALSVLDSLFRESTAREAGTAEWGSCPGIPDAWVTAELDSARPEYVLLRLTRAGKRELELWRARGRPGA